MLMVFLGKPNPDCFPFSGLSISLKGTDEKIELDALKLHDAFQYALQPGGVPDLKKARLKLFHEEIRHCLMHNLLSGLKISRTRCTSLERLGAGAAPLGAVARTFCTKPSKCSRIQEIRSLLTRMFQPLSPTYRCFGNEHNN
jgi:hypothetical protein